MMKKGLFRVFALIAIVAIYGIVLNGVSASGEFKAGFGLNIKNVANVGVAGTNSGTNLSGDQSLVTTVKKGINVVLGFMSLITLIILLWGGFQMVTANGDDGKFQKGMKLLKQAALGLLFIAVSWMMVSMIFWIIAQVGAKPG